MANIIILHGLSQASQHVQIQVLEVGSHPASHHQKLTLRMLAYAH